MSQETNTPQEPTFRIKVTKSITNVKDLHPTDPAGVQALRRWVQDSQIFSVKDGIYLLPEESNGTVFEIEIETDTVQKKLKYDDVTLPPSFKPLVDGVLDTQQGVKYTYAVTYRVATCRAESLVREYFALITIDRPWDSRLGLEQLKAAVRDDMRNVQKLCDCHSPEILIPVLIANS